MQRSANPLVSRPQPIAGRFSQLGINNYRVRQSHLFGRNFSKQKHRSERFVDTFWIRKSKFEKSSLKGPQSETAAEPAGKQLQQKHEYRQSDDFLNQLSNPIIVHERTKRLAQSVQFTNSFNIFLAVLFALLVIASVCVWVSLRVKRKPRSRRGSSATTAAKTTRSSRCAQIAQFYTTRSRSSSTNVPVFSSVQRTQKMLDTCVSRPRRFHSGPSNPCFSFCRAPRVQFSLNSPPSFSIGTPQPIQPGPRDSVQSDIGYGIRTTSESGMGRRRNTTGELHRTLLTKLSQPIVRQQRQSPLSDPGRQLFTGTRTATALSRLDIRETGWIRSNSARRPSRYSCCEESVIARLKLTHSNFGRLSLGETEDPTWTQLGSSLYGSGRISFSLLYVCTTGILVVTVNRLNGVHLITASGRLLPSQVETAFLVCVRLKADRKRETTISDGFTTNFSTHFVASHLNPIFDQSFSFKLAMNEIEAAQLVFTVYRTTLEPLSSHDLAKQRRLSQTSLSGTLSRRPSLHERTLNGDTVCLGSASYRLGRDDLINRPEKLRELWRDIRPEVDSDDECVPDLSGKEHSKVGSKHCAIDMETVTTVVKSSEANNVLSNKQSSSLRGESEKTSIEVSIQYESETSQLVVCLKDVRNLHLQPKDVYLFVRTVLYKGDKIMATARSPLVKTGLPMLCDWERLGFTTRRLSDSNTLQSTTSKTTTSTRATSANTADPFPLRERAQFPIDINRLVESSTLGIIIFLCSRSRFGQSRLVGQCSIGANGFTEGKGTQFWEELVNGVRQLKLEENQTSTAVFTSWQEVRSSSVSG